MKIFIHHANMVAQLIVSLHKYKSNQNEKQLQRGQKTLEAQFKFGHTFGP